MTNRANNMFVGRLSANKMFVGPICFWTSGHKTRVRV